MDKQSKQRLNEDIEKLKRMQEQLDKHSFDEFWKPTESDQEEFYRIVGSVYENFDYETLYHYIDGMERALHLKEIYDERFA